MRLPIPQFAVLLAGLLSVAQAPGRADREVLLVPRGYTGDIYIVFRVASGQPAAREGDARLYRLPPNGVLLTQEAPNLGISPLWTFYYETLTGEREPIRLVWASPVPDTPENRANAEIGIFHPVRGRHGNGPSACEFDRYFVGTRAQVLGHDRGLALQRLSKVLRGVGCEPAPPRARASSSPTEPGRPATAYQRLSFPGDQHLSVVYGRWDRGAMPLEIEDFAMKNLLLTGDRDLLDAAISSGRIVIRGESATNTVQSPLARMIVIFTGPLARSVNLQQPDATNVVYVQEGDTFARYPPDARLLDRTVEFTPDGNRPGLLRVSVEHASGARYGGSTTIGDR